jgi:hypothetical protein
LDSQAWSLLGSCYFLYLQYPSPSIPASIPTHPQVQVQWPLSPGNFLWHSSALTVTKLGYGLCVFQVLKAHVCPWAYH